MTKDQSPGIDQLEQLLKQHIEKEERNSKLMWKYLRYALLFGKLPKGTKIEAPSFTEGPDEPRTADPE